MTHTTESGLRRLSGMIATACALVAVAMPVLWAVAIPYGEPSDLLPMDLRHLEPGTGRWIFTQLLIAVPMVMTLTALWSARRCFKLFAAGAWFTAAGAAALKRMGAWLAAAGLTDLVLPTVIGLLLTFDAPPGERILTISLSSNMLLGILFSAMIWAFGALQERAADLAAENAGFV